MWTIIFQQLEGGILQNVYEKKKKALPKIDVLT
jgi:hypothetical protein